MRLLRDAWANASDIVKITIIVAVGAVTVAAVWAGLGLGWLPLVFGG